MIKVLEHGIRKITCPYCKARLQYESGDIQKVEIEESILTDGEVRKYIICPDCEETIFLTPIKR